MFRSETKLTQQESEDLRKRSEVLKKENEETQCLITQKKQLEKLIHARQQYEQYEQDDIDKKIFIEIDSTTTAVPPPLQPLLALLQLISRKHSIDIVSGKFNRLTEEVVVLFESSPDIHGHKRSKLEGHDAIVYLTSLGGKDKSLRGEEEVDFSAKISITLTKQQCKSAIEGLGLLTNPMKEDIAKKRAGGVRAIC